VPVFNEASHIVDVLQEVAKHAEDIVVIDDGSSDETAQILAEQRGIAVLTHDQNQGYGAALRTAFEFALDKQYDVLVTIDCDGQHEPRLIPELANRVFPKGEQPVDIVSGSRYLEVFAGDSLPPAQRRAINLKITEIINERLGLSLTDTFCGFKAYRVALLRQLQISELGYAMPLQLWVQAVAAGLRIVEFPVPLIYLEEERSFGGSLDDGDRRLTYYREVIDRELARRKFPCPAP
jgi:glycosyltransferase involved in cell wall biosynthesis